MVAGISLVCCAASADTITSEVSGDVEGATDSDHATTSTLSTPISAGITIPVAFPGTATAQAAQEIGVSGTIGAVAVSGTAGALEGALFTDGTPGPAPDGHNLTAVNRFVSEVTMDGPYIFSIRLPAARLKVLDFLGVGSSTAGRPIARFDIRATLHQGATTTTIIESSAELRGGQSNHTLTEMGQDLGGTFFAISPSQFGYQFNPFATRVDLGTLSAGDFVEYSMRTTVSGAGFELGGLAAVGNPLVPNNFGSTAGLVPNRLPTAELRASTNGLKVFRDTLLPPPFLEFQSDPHSDTQPVVVGRFAEANAETSFGNGIGAGGLFGNHEAQARSSQDLTDPLVEIDFGARSLARNIVPTLPATRIETFQGGPWSTDAEAVNIARIAVSPAPAGTPAGMEHTTSMNVFLDGLLNQVAKASPCVGAGCPPGGGPILPGDLSAEVAFRIILHRKDATGGTMVRQEVLLDESAKLDNGAFSATPGWANQFTTIDPVPPIGLIAQEELDFVRNLSFNVPFGEEFAIEILLTTHAQTRFLPQNLARFEMLADFFNSGSYTIESLTPGATLTFLDSSGRAVPEPMASVPEVASLMVWVLLTFSSLSRRAPGAPLLVHR
jgi:hypothetical protein